MKLHLVRPTESLCEHSIPPLSCGVCFADHAIRIRDERIKELEYELAQFAFRFAEEVRKRSELLRELAEARFTPAKVNS